MSRPPHDLFEKRYEEEIRRLSRFWPREMITLNEIAKGRRFIKLQSGDVHEFDQNEVRIVLSKVPVYLWDIMKLPIILKYKRFEDGTYEVKVEGDIWQKRLVEILLKGSMSSKGIDRLDSESFRELLSKYKTLIFIGLGGLEESEQTPIEES